MSPLVAVLQPRFFEDKSDAAQVLRPVEADFEEAQALTKAIELDVQHGEIIPVRKKSAATLFGKGTIERIGEILHDKEIPLVFVNGALSPIQQRNLERAWGVKVIDRQGLILEIFSARAKTREGKLQVELAALMYQRSRLVKAWSHLERQRGGLGKTGGPGETQKELDRRMIDDKIKQIRKDLEKIVRNRSVQRAARERVPFPVVALVGYTNAGKSTLFNTLTSEKVFAKDLLFATLDTTLRAVTLPSGRVMILSDTVGFISQLPADLVAAFRATLEETVHADIILHVRDIAAPYTEAERSDVIETLERMKLDDDVAVWEVGNKIDLLDDDHREKLLEGENRSMIFTSAITGEGLDTLLTKLDDALATKEIVLKLAIPVTDGEQIAWLYRHGNILERHDGETMIDLTLRLSPAKLGQFQHLFQQKHAS